VRHKHPTDYKLCSFVLFVPCGVPQQFGSRSLLHHFRSDRTVSHIHHPYLADAFKSELDIGGHSDLRNHNGFLTVAGQRRTCTELSPFPLAAAPRYNRSRNQILSHLPPVFKKVMFVGAIVSFVVRTLVLIK